MHFRSSVVLAVNYSGCPLSSNFPVIPVENGLCRGVVFVERNKVNYLCHILPKQGSVSRAEVFEQRVSTTTVPLQRVSTTTVHYGTTTEYHCSTTTESEYHYSTTTESEYHYCTTTTTESEYYYSTTISTSASSNK